MAVCKILGKGLLKEKEGAKKNEQTRCKKRTKKKRLPIIWQHACKIKGTTALRAVLFILIIYWAPGPKVLLTLMIYWAPGPKVLLNICITYWALGPRILLILII